MDSLFHQRWLTARPHPIVARRFSGADGADTMAPAAIAAHRSESLTAIVKRAYERSAFYRDKLDRAGVRPADVAGAADLGKLPFLRKDELRGDPWRLLTCHRSDVAIVQVSTGTTGGEEIYLAQTFQDYVLHDLAPRYSRLFPVGPGDICLNALPYEMSTAGLAFHKTFLEGYQATVVPAGKGGAYSTPEKTVKLMGDLRPTLLVTSPSWAVTLAEAAAEAGLDLPGLSLKKLWLTGEGCSPALRARIERMYGATASFFYGSLECGMLGIECDHHAGYHLPEAHVILEVVHPETGQPMPPGELGELVVTSLLRYDAPLLRFKTGDLGFVDTTACPCGVTMSRFHMRGRAVDQVRAAGKSVSPVLLEELLMRIPEVGSWYEIVQPGPDAASLRVRVEPAPGVPLADHVAAAISVKMQAATRIPFDVELVARLPRPTGKAARVVKE